VREQTPDEVWISTHCHNDLGLAVANSLAGVVNGARQVEVAVNGIGERAGNCAAEEIAMIVKTRGQTLGMNTQLNTKELMRTSRLVAMTTGYSVQNNKSVVGSSAFAHESGIHQHGVLANRATYEIMDPVEVGLEGNLIVLGKHSGRHAFVDALHEMGYELSPDALNHVFARFKELADRKIELTDQDLEAIVSEEVGKRARTEAADDWMIEEIEFLGGSDVSPKATVRMRRGDEVIEETAKGNGPIDAVCTAVQRATGVAAKLISFNVAAITGGTDALGDVVVQIEIEGRRVTGRGVSVDTVEASGLAYLAAINRSLQMTAPDEQADDASSAERTP